MRFTLTILLNGRTNDEKLMSVLSLIAGCFFTGFLWAICEAQEQAISETADTSAAIAPVINADSIRAEIQRLRNDADILRRKAEMIRDSLASSRDTPFQDRSNKSGNSLNNVRNEQYYPKKDTVQLLSRETAGAFLESINGKKRTARERGYGGGIGPSMSMYAINMGPVSELLDYMRGDVAFENSGLKIDKPFAPFQLSGICFYGAVGNGLRIGGNFLSGSRSYSSRRDDTTYNLEINPSFGGLLIEKATVHDNFNLFLGGMIGAGTIEVRPSKTTNPFTSIPLNTDNGKVSFNKLKAGSLLLEMHGGFTYTMINWLHLGAELSAPVFFSPSGFVTTGGHNITSGFISLNPGVRLRIMIGNIG
jgi:hypothetical protein